MVASIKVPGIVLQKNLNNVHSHFDVHIFYNETE